jgi:hypothetical protein
MEMKFAHVNKSDLVNYRVRQCGASLLEGIAYLGIAAIVILGAVSLLASAFGNAQANRSTEETVSLRTAARKLFSGQSYPSAMTAALVSAKAVPGTMNVDTSNGTVTNSFGGAVVVAGSGGTFTITYPAVPQDVCINMLSGASGWVSIGQQNATAITTMPITAANATTICSQAGGNSIVFTAA